MTTDQEKREPRTFAERWRDGLKTLGLSAEDIATHFGASVPTSQAWLDGKSVPSPGFKTLIYDTLQSLLELRVQTTLEEWRDTRSAIKSANRGLRTVEHLLGALVKAHGHRNSDGTYQIHASFETAEDAERAKISYDPRDRSWTVRSK